MIENLDKFGTNDGLRKITAETDVSKYSNYYQKVGDSRHGPDYLSLSKGVH